MFETVLNELGTAAYFCATTMDNNVIYNVFLGKPLGPIAFCEKFLNEK